MDAVLLINKPTGMTSFSVVSQCRKAFHEKKAGHTGTLDPNASGLMIVLIGRCTKLAPYCVSGHKHYRAEFILGQSYDTEDIWGAPMEEKVPSIYGDDILQKTAAGFIGISEQIPPMYSAIKVQGRKLYDLAREGKTIERQARQICVYSLEVHHLHENTYAMDAVVSSGTYIRTLIADYARALGEFGAMSRLCREGIEHLSLSEADELNDVIAGNYREADIMHVLDPSFPVIEYSDAQWIKNGRPVQLDCSEHTVILMNNNRVLAAYELRDDGLYHCARGLF
ncbi:MAG: tRNA pseudouridine(55) synthase TruB [Solobacterium sp.]|nr:tRNA pseudouridine(55) synthase TruB [Solobacterium sp.]